ncbi:UNVERIFIED_CONTAM: hypothetical protein Sindi_1613100 [Sesamum indicum]
MEEKITILSNKRIIRNRKTDEHSAHSVKAVELEEVVNSGVVDGVEKAYPKSLPDPKYKVGYGGRGRRQWVGGTWCLRHFDDCERGRSERVVAKEEEGGENGGCYDIQGVGGGGGR